MDHYERAMRQNMASADRDLKLEENRRGFVIGAVLKSWEVYNKEHKINEQQFDHLIGVLKEFSKGKYKDFIEEQVKQYKGGNPPIILGY